MRRTLVLLVSIVAVTGVHAPRAIAVTRTNGIDVSHWQETIDWAKVATTDVKFAIAKATDGQTYVDPQYAANKAGATANGLRFGAYHFARPDGGRNDAKREASHFLRTAGLTKGLLVPTLDLEASGGLSATALKTWVRQWLGKVTGVLGVRPMIYTSRGFWESFMGNTDEFARRGYRVLWIAHWTDDPDPTLPANDWGGHGWTFWQYTDCRTVAGIAGCVDGDRYNGTDFTPVTI
jgi:GH25 family lysozyme M1 (1,4-beta-N-acetylmuramidase)